MNSVRIGFAGKMYTGKDTCADLWLNHFLIYASHHPEYKAPVRRLAFATKLKDICRELLRLDTIDLYSPDGKKRFNPRYGKTCRQLMQDVGEGMRTAVHPDIWVFALEDKINELLQKDGNSNLLVTDIRYYNELQMLKRFDFTLIKLVRDTGVKDNHSSEQELDDELFDYVVENNGTIAELEAKLLLLPEYQFD